MKINTIKKILSKIVIESNKNKTLVYLIERKNSTDFLNFLWKEGYIYGYNQISDIQYQIFLKHNYKSSIFYKNVNFKKNIISASEIRRLAKLEKNSMYLINTKCGIISSKTSINKNIGGSLIAKF